MPYLNFFLINFPFNGEKWGKIGVSEIHFGGHRGHKKGILKMNDSFLWKCKKNIKKVLMTKIIFYFVEFIRSSILILRK